MKFSIDDQEIEISDQDLESSYINEGNESTVYEYYDKVLKIYKKYCNKDRLTEEEVELLKQIKTSRILLPLNILYDKDKKFIGYTLKSIMGCSLENIKRMKIKNLKKELELIRNDIKILSENGISLEDFHKDNILYDGSLYMIDPGNYKKVDTDPSELYKENIRLFNYFFLRDILFRIIKFSRTQKNNLEIITDSEGFIGDILEDDDKNLVSFLNGISK